MGRRTYPKYAVRGRAVFAQRPRHRGPATTAELQKDPDLVGISAANVFAAERSAPGMRQAGKAGGTAAFDAGPKVLIGTAGGTVPVTWQTTSNIDAESALGMVEELSHAVVGIDFDGTLSPVTPHPRDARMDAAAACELRRIAEAGATVGVVTGRSVESLLEVAGAELAAIPNLVVEGMYGAERWSDGVLHTMPTPRRMHSLRREVPSAVRATVFDPEVWIEDKRLSLVVHTRMGDDPEALQAALAGPLADVAAEHDMELHLGKEVLELRLRGIDKATAVERLVGPTCRTVVYAGDDVGDLPAFATVKRWRDRTALPGITIGVVADASSPIAGEADWEVRDSAELGSTLRALGS